MPYGCGRCASYAGDVTVPDPALLAKLRAAISSGPPLRLAVLFGSRATGRATTRSDADVGIVPMDRQLVLGEELALASALSAACGLEVDVVRLDEDAPLLGREVAHSGLLLFEAEPGTFTAWRATAMSRFIEFEEIIAPHRERFLRRLAGGRA